MLIPEKACILLCPLLFSSHFSPKVALKVFDDECCAKGWIPLTRIARFWPNKKQCLPLFRSNLYFRLVEFDVLFMFIAKPWKKNRNWLKALCLCVCSFAFVEVPKLHETQSKHQRFDEDNVNLLADLLVRSCALECIGWQVVSSCVALFASSQSSLSPLLYSLTCSFQCMQTNLKNTKNGRITHVGDTNSHRKIQSYNIREIFAFDYVANAIRIVCIA